MTSCLNEPKKQGNDTENQVNYDNNSSDQVMVDTSAVDTLTVDYEPVDTSAVITLPKDKGFKYFIYCTVHLQSFDRPDEGNFCSQIIYLDESDFNKFREKFRNQDVFETLKNSYGINVDRSTFELKKFETYEEALKDKESNRCGFENEIPFY